jgi:peptidoglycan/LPS O-acetylase OafA/YrhL
VSVLIFVYLISAAFYAYFQKDVYGLDEQLPVQLRFFVVGILLLNYMDKLNYWRSVLYVLVSLAILAAIAAGLSAVLFNALFYPLIVGFGIYFLAFFTPRFRVRWDLSYPIYVLHFPIIHLFLYFGIFKFGLLYF